MNRQEKEAMVAELAGKARASQAMLVADYRGLTVAEARELRTEMRAAGADYQVIKNTLMILAADAAELPEMKQFLGGPSAIAFCEEEPVAPAKVLMKYVKEFKPLEVKGGVLEGQMIDADKIKFLASLPPREVLLSQLVGAFQSPARGMVTVLTAPMRGLVTVLSKVQELKEAEEAA